MLKSIHRIRSRLAPVPRRPVSTAETEERYVLLEVTKRAGSAYGYKPRQTLSFDSAGKMCLYYYKPRFCAYLSQYSKTLVPFLGNAYLMKIHYFAYTMPVLYPLQFCVELYLIKKMLEQKMRFRKMAGEIYLHKDGELLEVVSQQKLWKRLNGDPIKQFHHIPRLVPPQQENHPERLKGFLFPEEEPSTQEDLKQMQRGFMLTKYYRNPKFFINLRTKAQVFNTELLTNIFMGNVIIVDPKQTGETGGKSALEHAVAEQKNLGNHKVQE